jgi:hypothetical protein
VRIDETIDAIESCYTPGWTDGLLARHHSYRRLRPVRLVQSARRRGTGSAWCPNVTLCTEPFMDSAAAHAPTDARMPG